jgi:hypothetical protein
LRHVGFKYTDVSEEHTASITIRAMMMEAVRISETSVYNNEATRRSIPEGYHLKVAILLELS